MSQTSWGERTRGHSTTAEAIAQEEVGAGSMRTLRGTSSRMFEIQQQNGDIESVPFVLLTRLRLCENGAKLMIYTNDVSWIVRGKRLETIKNALRDMSPIVIIENGGNNNGVDVQRIERVERPLLGGGV